MRSMKPSAQRWRWRCSKCWIKAPLPAARLSSSSTRNLPHSARHVYHIYAIRVRMRSSVMMALAEKGIDCGIHYPIPIHRQKAYHFLKLTRGRFPVAERSAEELLSLPMFPELTKEQIEYVVHEIRRCSGVEKKSFYP